MSSTFGYIPALDGIRGIAILLVLGFHIGWLPGGFVGVDVFFTLSGYLITKLLVKELQETGRVDIRGFYTRRARRLLPALAAVLLFVLLGVSGPTRDTLDGVMASLLYMANIYRALGHHLPDPLTPMWSLAQEEQFYFAWPVTLFLVTRWRPRALAPLLAAALVCVVGWRCYLVAAHGVSLRVYFGPDTHADPLIVGCFTALIPLGRLARFAPAAPLLLAAAAVGFREQTVSSTTAAPIVGAASAILLISSAGPPTESAGSTIERMLVSSPLVATGAISYSLYLWHAPIFLLFNDAPAWRPLAAAISFAVAAASYRFIEQPFRGRRSPRLEPAGAPL